MSKTITRIGPTDHGRRMSLEEFAHAEQREGYLYELSPGIIAVTDVPKRRHLLLVTAIRDWLQSYKALHPGRIHIIAARNECKLPIVDLDSERHPDLALYLTAPPEEDDEDFWIRWVPRDCDRGSSSARESETTNRNPRNTYALASRNTGSSTPTSEPWLSCDGRDVCWVESTIRPPAIHRT